MQSNMAWYESLAKPAWTPAPSVIGTVWTILYPIILVAYGYVLYRVITGTMPPSIVVPVGINLAANFAFTPIQFGLRNLPLSTAVILVVGITIVWSMVAVWPYSRWVAIALVPYLIWVLIATSAQVAITLMNS